MMDFENEHMRLIEEYENSALEIERAIFTKRYHLNSFHYAIFSVQSISMLYSYWEGFICRSFQMYVDYINEKTIRFDLLNNEIVVYHMESTFRQLKEYPKKTTQKIAYFQKLKAHYSNETQAISRNINTHSNVGFDELNRLLRTFSLKEYPERWADYNYPNPSLKEMLMTFLRLRNGVAHGGDISSEEKVKQELFSKYRQLVNDLMYDLHERFMDGIRTESYLK